MGLDFHGVYLKGYITTFHPNETAMGVDSLVDNLGMATGSSASQFIGPIATVATEPKIKKVTSKRYELWVDPITPEFTGDAAALKCLSYVRDVTCVINLGYNSKLSVTLTPPFEEGLAFLNSELIQWGIGHLMMSIGYSTGSGNNQTLPMGGFIQKPEVKIGRDIQITLHAMGVGYHLQNSGDTFGDPKILNGVYSEAVAVKKILERYNSAILSNSEGDDTGGLLIDDLYSDFTDAEKDSKTGHIFFREQIYENPPQDPGIKPEAPKRLAGQTADRQTTAAAKAYAQSVKTYEASLENWNKRKAEYEQELTDRKNSDNRIQIQKGAVSDWWFVYETCRKRNLDLFVVDRNVRIRNPDRWKTEWPKMIFALRGKIDTEASIPIYPINEFDSPSTHIYYGSGMGAFTQVDIDENLKKVSKSANNQTVPTTQAGTNQAYDSTKVNPSSGVPQECAAALPGDPSTQAYNDAETMYKNAQALGGIEVNITSLGIPNLLPGMIVYVTGISPRKFDGNYGVVEVEHKIGANGFTTKFKAKGGLRVDAMTALATGFGNIQTPPIAAQAWGWLADTAVNVGKKVVEPINQDTPRDVLHALGIGSRK
jgi:hypothetical protein